MRSALRTTRAARLGLALTAMLLLAIAISASASAALPEINPAPTVTNPLGITITGGPGGSIENNVREAASCSHFGGSGSMTSARTGTVTLTMSECTTLPSYCHAKGNVSAITTVELEVVLVYIKGSTHTVGFELRPKSGGLFAELESGFKNLCELKGSLIATTKVAEGKSFPFTLSGLNGVQQPSQYENEGALVNSWLEFQTTAGGWRKESWSSAATMTTSHLIQIRG
jgi:hypothetical protein